MTKRKPGIRPIGDNRTVRIASHRRAQPDLELFAKAVAQTLIAQVENKHRRDKETSQDTQTVL